MLFLSCGFSIAQIKMNIDFKHCNQSHFQEFLDTNTWDKNDRLYNVSCPRVYFYKAKNSNSKKSVIICPGGGFKFLAINQEGRELAEKLAHHGINSFVFYYKTHPIAQKHLNKEYTVSREKLLSTASLDLQRIIYHLRKKSKDLQINPNDIGLIGFSAGGSLAVETVLSSSITDKPNFLAAVYTGNWITKSTSPPKNTPLFLSCSKDDPLGLYPVTMELSELWERSNEEVKLLIYEKGGHGYGMNKKGLPLDGWSDEFINWILKL